MSEAAIGDPGRPAGSPGAGALLLAERRRQGLSLGDISRQLKLSVRQVEALERDDFAMFHSPVFVHGFIRNYAKLLGMEPAPLLAQADSVLEPATSGKAQSVSAVTAEVEVQPRRRRSGAARVAGGIAFALVLATVVYFSGSDRNGDAPPEPTLDSVSPEVAALQENPVVATVAQALDAADVEQPAAIAPESNPVGGAVIRMVFDQESWVEIKDGNGNIVFGQLMSAGSRRSIVGTPPLSVVIGNADGVRLSYQSRDVDLAPHTRVNVARLTLE